MDHAKACAAEMRAKAAEMPAFEPLADLMNEAANTIERLQKENAGYAELMRRQAERDRVAALRARHPND